MPKYQFYRTELTENVPMLWHCGKFGLMVDSLWMVLWKLNVLHVSISLNSVSEFMFRLSFKLFIECSTSIPSAPAGTAATAWDGQTSVGSNVFYQCSASSGSINALVNNSKICVSWKLFSQCGSDGNWHMIGECPSVPITTTTTTTAAPSCTWTRIYKNTQTQTFLVSYKGVKRSKDCLQKCKVCFKL